jgi:hypothetical protein
LREDLDIFERTAAAAQGEVVDGPVYPLIVSMTPSHDQRNGRYQFSTFPARKMLAINFDEPCANVGLTVVGFMSIAEDTHSRERHRSTEHHHWKHHAPCIKFVYVIGVEGLPETQRTQLEKEKQLHKDIVMLGMHENMNHGKSFEWFKFALEEFPKAMYIAKGDVDAFVHPIHLAQQLSSLPSRNLLYGFDCQHNMEYKRGIKSLKKMSKKHSANTRLNVISTGMRYSSFDTAATFSNSWDEVFMCGMFYLFSRDTIECAMKSDGLKVNGPEDFVASNWPVQAACPLNYTSDMYRFFDYPGKEKGEMGAWGQQLGWNKDAVCIHHLKSDRSWQDVNEMLCKTEKICER